jgi:hypothetical protein
MVREPANGKSCFGSARRLEGQNLVPAPPAIKTANRRCLGIKVSGFFGEVGISVENDPAPSNKSKWTAALSTDPHPS